MNSYFNKELTMKLINEYPDLKTLFRAGLLSRRLCKNALGITKWEMDDLYTDLVKAGAIKILSSSAFKATNDTMSLIARMDDKE